MTTRREILLLPAAAMARPVRAQTPPIRIGEINSYSTIPQFTVPYRMGWQLAVEEANAAGGLLGRKVEVISRDDAGKPDDAIRLATELVSNEKVALLTGDISFQCRAGRRRIRAAQQGAVRCRGTIDRRHGVGKGQPLHIPAAAQHVHAVGDAGRGGRTAAGQALGDRCAELRVRAVGSRQASRRC